MIVLRAQPPLGLEWDDITFSGENEELLAHKMQDWLEEAGWELMAATDGGEFEELS